eukprot:s571_g21.t1
MAHPSGYSQATGAQHFFRLEINASGPSVAKIFGPERSWSKYLELQLILLSNTEFQGTCATSFSTKSRKRRVVSEPFSLKDQQQGFSMVFILHSWNKVRISFLARGLLVCLH